MVMGQSAHPCATLAPIWDGPMQGESLAERLNDKCVYRPRSEPQSELSPGQSLVTTRSLSPPMSLWTRSDPHMTQYAAHKTPFSIITRYGR